MLVDFQLLDPICIPEKAHSDDACWDIRAREDKMVKVGEIVAIPAGFKIAIPEGFEGQVRGRSGLAIKHGLLVVNGPGTIDTGYRGEVGVILTKVGRGTQDFTPDYFEVRRGMRIAQFLIKRIPAIRLNEVDKLSETERGENGLGSTGHETNFCKG